MKNKIVFGLLIICVLGLLGYIVYDKMLSNDNDDNVIKEDDNNVNNLIATSALDFIDKIANSGNVLGTESIYVVSYNDLKFTAFVNEPNSRNIGKFEITYKGNVINTALQPSDLGYHTLKTYYFDKDSGAYIITMVQAPVAAVPSLYVFVFDNNGNVLMDEYAVGEVIVNEEETTLLHNFQLGGGITCFTDDMNPMEKYLETILYEYKNDKLNIINREALLVRDLPKCE